MEEMMMVSMVIHDTGLRAVVAMALAATEVKKNENSSASATPVITMAGVRCVLAEDLMAKVTTTQQDGRYRHIAVQTPPMRAAAAERFQRHAE
jgi:hypothetical protein